MAWFDWLFTQSLQYSESQDPISIEDQSIGQSDQATDQQISIQAGFPQSVLILDQNFPFSMIISIDRVPRPVSPVIIFLPFPEDRLWRARLDTIRRVPSIPDQYLCLVILADDEAQKKMPNLKGVKCNSRSKNRPQSGRAQLIGA